MQRTYFSIYLRLFTYYLIGGALFFLSVALLYWPGLDGGFFFDDSANIVESRGVQLRDLSLISLMGAWESGIAGPLGRPVSMLSFAINYYLSGFDPYWFKLTNVVIHGVNGILIYALCLLILRATRKVALSAVKTSVLATAVALLWTFHPIQLTSVLYVVQRMTSLSSMFLLLALILHVWARQQNKFDWKVPACYASAWGLLLPLAMLSKETGVLYLLYVAVYELILQRSYTGSLDRFSRAYLALLFLGGVGLLIYLGAVPEAGLLGGYVDRSFTLTQRVLTEFRIVWVYVQLIVAPAMPVFGLYHDDFSISTGLFEPAITAVSVFGLFTFGLSALLLWKKAPVVSFGVLWFLVGHSLESTIFPLELMHEHRNYLPSFGIFVLVIPLLMSEKMAQPIYRLLTTGSVLAFLLYSILITHLRADMYGDDFRRSQIEAGHRMGSVRSQYEAGAILTNMFHRQRNPILASLAEKHFDRVNVLDPTYKLALVGMLQLDCLSDRNVSVEIYEELRNRLNRGKWVPLDRTVMHGIAAMSNEGSLCLSRRQVDELFSTAEGSKALTLQDRSVLLSDYALYLWIGEKDYIAAREVLKRAVAGNEHDVLNRMNLLQLMRFLGEREETLRLLADLQVRKLGRQDMALLQAISAELAVEGVAKGE